MEPRGNIKPAALFLAGLALGTAGTLAVKRRSGRPKALTQALTIDAPAQTVMDFFKEPRRLVYALGADDDLLDLLEVESREPDLLVWRTRRGRTLDGGISLRPAPGGRGTELRMTLHLAGTQPFTKPFNTVRGADPKSLVKDAVRRAKALLEAGELPTGRWN